jgi:uncharacterized protein YjbI with pentapeptide repeats
MIERNDVKFTTRDGKKAVLKWGEDWENIDLKGANLQGADLSGANLYLANINETQCHGTNFSGATMPDGSIHE